MKRMTVIAAALTAGLAVLGCTTPLGKTDSRWQTLIDGAAGLDNFNRLGDANWRAEGGAIVADKGKGGFLVTKNSYKDFEIVAELWAESSTNSGIFIRCTEAGKITAANCYEVNVWDTRPDPTYATGAIVDFASVPTPIIHKAGGKWNTLEIYAKGNQITVKFNGVVSVHMQNDKFPAGPFALQFGAGVGGALGGPIKWRRVEVRPL